MPLDFLLIDFEEFASIIGMFGYALLILSAQQSREKLIQEQEGITSITPGPDPAVTASTATWIRFFAIVILTITAYIRLQERAREIQSGKSTESLTPNINITWGSFISLAGFLLLAIGVQQRAEQSGAPVTIL
jgi:hypothetical protein